MFFKYFNNLSPLNMNDVFKSAGQITTAARITLLKLNQPLKKINHGLTSLSYVVPSYWSKLPYKHRVKKHCFRRMNNKENDIYSCF